MSITAQPSPNLLSIPNEILAEICTYATDGDDSEGLRRNGKSWLKAVRLTCKQLYDPSTIVFGKRHLSHLSIMVARGSLEELLKICGHRLIGPQVQKISLFGCRLDRKLLQPLREDLDYWIRRNDLQSIRHARLRLQLFLDFLEEEMEFGDKKGIFQLLVNALSKLWSYGRSMSLAVFTDLDDRLRPILGRREAVEQISENNRLTLRDKINCDAVRCSLNTLCSAAIESSCRVHQLSLEVYESWYEAASSQRERSNGVTSYEKKVLLDVKDLYLVADSFTDNLDGLVKTVFLHTKNLETLYLWPMLFPDVEVYWAHVNSFGRTIRSLQSDRLHKIEFEEAVCRQKDLISLLARHRKTLRELHLTNFGLVGSWEDVMIWIRDHCSLTCLSVSGLEEYDKDGYQISSTVPNNFPNDLSRLDEFLEQRRAKQAELEEED